MSTDLGKLWRKPKKLVTDEYFLLGEKKKSHQKPNGTDVKKRTELGG